MIDQNPEAIAIATKRLSETEVSLLNPSKK